MFSRMKICWHARGSQLQVWKADCQPSHHTQQPFLLSKMMASQKTSRCETTLRKAAWSVKPSFSNGFSLLCLPVVTHSPSSKLGQHETLFSQNTSRGDVPIKPPERKKGTSVGRFSSKPNVLSSAVSRLHHR